MTQANIDISTKIQLSCLEDFCRSLVRSQRLNFTIVACEAALHMHDLIALTLYLPDLVHLQRLLFLCVLCLLAQDRVVSKALTRSFCTGIRCGSHVLLTGKSVCDWSYTQGLPIIMSFSAFALMLPG